MNAHSVVIMPKANQIDKKQEISKHQEDDSREPDVLLKSHERESKRRIDLEDLDMTC